MVRLQKTEKHPVVPSTWLRPVGAFDLACGRLKQPNAHVHRVHFSATCADKQTCSQHIVTIASALQAVRRIRSIFHAQAFLLAASWHNALHRCLSNHEEARPQRLQC